jgi:hypothetical protein
MRTAKLHEVISESKIATIINSDGERKKSCRLTRMSRFGKRDSFRAYLLAALLNGMDGMRYKNSLSSLLHGFSMDSRYSRNFPLENFFPPE